MEQLTIETVNYAYQKGNHSFSLSTDEMKVFIGILLLSGYTTVSRRRLYWSSDPDVHIEMVSSSMRQNRFHEIMKYFHAADNSKLLQNDRFSNVQHLLNIFNATFLKFATVFGSTTVSIDESMIPYFGRYPTK